ncbi:hypothetical protein EDD11_003186 [Mortierella claussenii]|nr:hypothetical protein EDD11_003186 [Mortierella claussenii]
MQSVGSFFSTVSKFYSELNPATLSGAIDVVVVEQPNGDLACSPFHVRFGKLSILRPQEKVVEVTINGRVVDFPMKVGDAGEAFFVFETEQEVPEEFATSPLAGPSKEGDTRAEDEIDFLDLAQGNEHRNEHATAERDRRGSNHAVAGISLQDDPDTGYVSAHSGHGSEFEEDNQESPSLVQEQTRDYPAALNFDDLKGLKESGGSYGDDVEKGVLKSRLSISISLPSSPVLKGRNIMENFQPVDSIRLFGQGIGYEQDKTEQTFSAADELLSPGSGGGVIMDMTGYKTDDSMETDLDSNGPSEKGAHRVAWKARRKRTRFPQSAMQLPLFASPESADVSGVKIQEQKRDPRLPFRPTHYLSDRILPGGLHLKKRASSLPNLREPEAVEDARTRHSKKAIYGPGQPSRKMHDEVVNSSVKGLWAINISPAGSAASSSPVSQNNQSDFPSEDNRYNQYHYYHQHHHHHDRPLQNRNGTLNTAHPRRHSHKPTEQLHTPRKSLARSNSALNALSDTELECQTPRSAKTAQSSEWSWGWGSLPVKTDSMEDVAAEADDAGHVSIDMASPPKPVLNEMEIDGAVYKMAISLCPGDDFGKDLVASETLFATHQISFHEFAEDPLRILNNKSLVCLINDRYFTWAAAGPYLASLVLFKKPLSDDTLYQLSRKDARHLSDRTHAQQPSTRFGALSRWLRGSQNPAQSDDAMEQGQSLPRPPKSDGAVSPDRQISPGVEEGVAKRIPDPRLRLQRETMTRSSSMPIDTGKSISVLEEGNTPSKRQQSQDSKANSKRYAKTLRLTSEQLRSLNLKKGANTLTFSVTSSYQGKAICSAKLFLWDHDVQVVISDIDGTITKSDALGHIFTMAGKDWTHTGVAKLYTDIANNGYHILYLTSRAIGQADYTRKYLKNVEQNNYQLPDGPVIMSPDRLMTAFHREVILRKPEEFKMACLRDIKKLFGDRNPFYAGFGNRITDALSYRSVGVESSRIYHIDSTGEVKLELLSTYKSSYVKLNDLVNEIFPGKRQAPEFNDWNYWKPILPTIELPMAPSLQPVLPQNPIDVYSSSNGGSGRLGVIRSFTNSFTSSGPLKKRPSIPAFSSTPSTLPLTNPSFPLSPRLLAASITPPSSSALTSPTLTPTSLHPSISAPAGLQIVDRTRRLSLSLMKYGGSSGSTPPSPGTHQTDRVLDESNKQAQCSVPGTVPMQGVPTPGARARGMSVTSSYFSGYIPSSLSVSPPTSYASYAGGSDADNETGATYPLEIQSEKKPSSFSVSPPQIASRLTETMIPFLRRKTPKVGQMQGEEQGSRSHQEGSQNGQSGLDSEQRYQDKSYDDDEGQMEEEEGVEEYDDDYSDEEGAGELDDDMDDDVELNIDAPFL